MRIPTCKVTLLRGGPLHGMSVIWCNICRRTLGTFSQHESAMNWAQAHARSKKHIPAGSSSG